MIPFYEDADPGRGKPVKERDSLPIYVALRPASPAEIDFLSRILRTRPSGYPAVRQSGPPSPDVDDRRGQFPGRISPPQGDDDRGQSLQIGQQFAPLPG